MFSVLRLRGLLNNGVPFSHVEEKHPSLISMESKKEGELHYTISSNVPKFLKLQSNYFYQITHINGWHQGSGRKQFDGSYIDKALFMHTL